MKNKLPAIYIFLIVLVCIFSVIILHHAENNTALVTKKNNVDSFIVNGTVIRYNKNGQLQSTIVSQKITYELPQKNTVFEKPHIVTYTDTRIPWHIHADNAIVNHKGTKVILNGHVIVHELKPTQTTTFKTSQLILFPKKSLASTDKAITLQQPGIIIHGVGFDANLKTGQYELHSQSTGIYQFHSAGKK
jgi:lipopolysaccharide export system protein LptC